jgi:SAM-dependent methyltransferase
MSASLDLAPLASAVLLVCPEPERALEVECAAGAEGALFLAREFLHARIRGVDRDEDAIRAATTRVGLDPEGRVAFKAGTPGSLPYPDDHFDLLAQLRGGFDAGEAARVLRPGGWALLGAGVGAAGLLGRFRSTARVAAGAGFERLDGSGPAVGDFLVMRLGREPTAGARV